MLNVVVVVVWFHHLHINAADKSCPKLFIGNLLFILFMIIYIYMTENQLYDSNSDAPADVQESKAKTLPTGEYISCYIYIFYQWKITSYCHEKSKLYASVSIFLFVETFAVDP